MSCPVCKKNHHGLCHKCPHAVDVAAGRYSDRAWEKTPCSACKHAEDAPYNPSHQGQTFVELDATDFDRPVEAHTERASEMADFLREFMLLSRREQIIVQCRYLHITGIEDWRLCRIAKRLRITHQAVHAIQRRVERKIPAFAYMFDAGAKD